MNGSARLVLTLTVISVISALVLGGTYVLCAPLIAEQKALRQREAIFAVVPNAADYKDISSGDYEIFEVYDDAGNVAGLAYVAVGPGFQGMIKMMVGLDPEAEKMTGVEVLEHQETPGLGARITEPWFQEQFKDKLVSDAFVPKEDVEAISGATISSKAVSDILKNTSREVLGIYRGGES